MSLYYEAAEVLTAPRNAGGSLKSRIFSGKELKSQPSQIYALAIESCKWSPVLREVIEASDILSLERKLTPILSILLVHDLLLAKKGIALPATHGLRTSIERHKGRLQAELTKARIRRKLSTVEALKAHVEAGQENTVDGSEKPYPRWIRINTLKTSLEDQLASTFQSYSRAASIDAVRVRGEKRLFVDTHVPNLLAVSPSLDLSKSEAYRSGAIIFQDKASCFPAYLLDPLPQDGDVIDSCAAPGNKTTHVAAIVVGRAEEAGEEGGQRILAFEKNKGRAETLGMMIGLAGSESCTKVHAGQDFLRTNPEDKAFRKVGALLLDPSCSGSGIVGRDDMPELCLPVLKQGAKGMNGKQVFGGAAGTSRKKAVKTPDAGKETRKRKREDPKELEVLVDDDGVVTAVNTEDELKARLTALSSFQLELLLHAFKFPKAQKITYSTCSIHAEENEFVVKKALESANAKERGWRILKREDQIRGMREWPVRGSLEACEGDSTLAEACIRANKGDEHGTMGFFLAGCIRDQNLPADMDAHFLRDERGNMVRDLTGMPVRVGAGDGIGESDGDELVGEEEKGQVEDGEEWGGFGENEAAAELEAPSKVDIRVEKPRAPPTSKHAHDPLKRRVGLVAQDKKRKKGKK